MTDYHKKMAKTLKALIGEADSVTIPMSELAEKVDCYELRKARVRLMLIKLDIGIVLPRPSCERQEVTICLISKTKATKPATLENRCPECGQVVGDTLTMSG